MPIPANLTAPAVAGTMPASEQGALSVNPEALRCRPGYPWFYVHYGDHPGNWFTGTIENTPEGAAEFAKLVEAGMDPADAQETVDPAVGTWWLPQIQTDPVIPGVNNVHTIKVGQKRDRAYRDRHTFIRSDGGVVLDHKLGYCHAKDCVDPRTEREGTIWLDAWSTPKKRMRGMALKFNFDRQRFYRWLLSLMQEGVIEPPTRDIVDHRLGKMAERVERKMDLEDIDPAKRERLVNRAATAHDQMEGAEVPEPLGRVRPGQTTRPPSPFPVLDLSVPALRKVLGEGEEDERLEVLLGAEMAGRNRKGALAAIQARYAHLAPPGGSEPEGATA